MNYKISRNRYHGELLCDKIKWNGKWINNYLGRITYYTTKTLTEEYCGYNLPKAIDSYNEIIDETDLILNDLESNISDYILSIKKEIYFKPYNHIIENDDYYIIKENGIYRKYDNKRLIQFELDYNNNEIIFPKRGFKDDFYGEKMYDYIFILCEIWFKIYLNYRKEVYNEERI